MVAVKKAKKSNKPKPSVSPLKLKSKVQVSPVLAIVIILVMIAVGYLLVRLTFAAQPGPGAPAKYNRAAKNAPQSCGQTTGRAWIGLTSDPGGQVECMNGSTVYPKSSKR